MRNTYTASDADETAPLISSKDTAKDPAGQTANSLWSPRSTCGCSHLCGDPQRGCVSGRAPGLASANPTIPRSPGHVSGSGYESSASSSCSSSSDSSSSDGSSSESGTPARRSLGRMATYHVDEPTWRKVWEYLECSRAHEASQDVEDTGANDEENEDEACLTPCFFIPTWLSSVLWPAPAPPAAPPASMSEAPPNHHHHSAQDDAQPTRHQHMRQPQPTHAVASSTAPGPSSSLHKEPRYVIKFPSGRRVERYQDPTTRRIVLMELRPGH